MNMTVKWRLLSWLIYTVGVFLVLLIGFNWLIALSLSIIIGFVCGLMNEIIQIQLVAHEEILKKHREETTETTDDEDFEEIEIDCPGCMILVYDDGAQNATQKESLNCACCKGKRKIKTHKRK